MKKEDITPKVLNLTPLQLVIFTYELIISDINSVINEDVEDKIKVLENARELLSTLVEALDMEQEISVNLLELYIYVNKLISQSIFKIGIDKEDETKEILKEAEEILIKLHSAWIEIEKEDTTKIEDNNHIIAGLTYENGKLSEYVLDEKGKTFDA